MRVLILTVALLGSACQIDPVIMNPEPAHSGCRDAARDYCRYVLKEPHDGMDECMARHTFECESGKR